ncbi:hypothetical protein ElyMa_003059400, partial [Elysia marginata]
AVSKRRRQKQSAVVCGLPLSLTLPDGSTVSVTPMSENQVSQILAIRRQAEILGVQPGLGITNCLCDEDFRSEVKDVHKFAITMIADVSGQQCLSRKRPKKVSEIQGNISNKTGGRYCVKLIGKESESKTKEEDIELPKDLTESLHCGGINIEKKPEDTCHKVNSTPKTFSAGHAVDDPNHPTISKESNIDSKESSSAGVQTNDKVDESHDSSCPKGPCITSGKKGGIIDPKFVQGSSGKFSPTDIARERTGQICPGCQNSKKCNTVGGAPRESLVAGVILTDSKYYRGPSFVTPWSFVSPAYMGRGLDSLCLSISELMATRLGFWGLYLDMLVTDRFSVALVERRAGYARVGTLPHVEMDKAGQPVGCHVYYKDLRQVHNVIERKSDTNF